MNDSDNYNIENNNLDDNLNDNKPDNEGSWSKGNYAKINNDKTSDIYERFISRVQSINSVNDKTDEADKTSTSGNVESFEPSAYEPLSDEDLQFFISAGQTSDTQQINTITSNDEDNAIELSLEDSATFDDDTSVLVLSTETKIDSDSKQTGALKGRQVGSLKLLIIGIVCGLLISAVMVMLLNTTGIVATLSDSLTSNNSQVTTVNTSVPDAIAESSANKDMTVKADDASLDNSNINELSLDNPNVIVADANSIDETVNIDKLSTNDSINKSESVNDQEQDTSSKVNKKNPTAKENTETKADNIKTDNARTETMISYEDFAEEAQSTLYRETNN